MTGGLAGVDLDLLQAQWGEWASILPRATSTRDMRLDTRLRWRLDHLVW